MTILLAGGGTLGSVSPLLAVAPLLRQSGHDLYFIGTRSGPERQLIISRGIQYSYIIAPKLRRYFSFHYFLVPFQLLAGLCQAFVLLLLYKPDVIVSAGGYVSVPLVWIGWCLRIPSVIHQQDIQTGLANKLMVPFAARVTVAFEESVQQFPSKKTEWIGNPVRNLEPTTNEFLVEEGVPMVLVMGGGTGAQVINELVSEELLQHAQVVHLTGMGKKGMQVKHKRYHKREFANEEIKEAMNKATVVVARAGLGTISELSALGKPSILIPMPHSHQEDNAALLERHNAAVVLNQTTLTPDKLTEEVVRLLQNEGKRKELTAHIRSLFKSGSRELFFEQIVSLEKK